MEYGYLLVIVHLASSDQPKFSCSLTKSNYYFTRKVKKSNIFLNFYLNNEIIFCEWDLLTVFLIGGYQLSALTTVVLMVFPFFQRTLEVNKFEVNKFGVNK